MGSLGHTGPTVDGGSIPTPSLHFIEISPRDATELVIEHHYAHRQAPITWAWGIEVAGRIQGVLTIGKPCTWSTKVGIVGETEPDLENPKARCHDVFELNRLWAHDDLPRNTESRFIGWCLRQVRALHPNIILVSYADGDQGHIGGVYKATNWLYLGVSIKFKDIIPEGMTCNYRSVAEDIRGGVVFECPVHSFFEGPLPPKNKGKSRELPAVPDTLPCPQCHKESLKLRSRAWCFRRESDGILKKRGNRIRWNHFVNGKIYKMTLQPRTGKHQYVWFSNRADQSLLPRSIQPYPTVIAPQSLNSQPKPKSRGRGSNIKERNKMVLSLGGSTINGGKNSKLAGASATKVREFVPFGTN